MSQKSSHSSASHANHPPKQRGEELADYKRSILLRWVERLALIVERPFTWLGKTSLNLFYHTDTLSVFLWLIVALSGLYLMLFYQFGFDAGYKSVAKMEGQFIAHIVRAIHRYASDSAIIVTILHGIRLFFQGRFRGARWLAWVGGVAMLLLLSLDGLTGYWLIWDQRSQLITNSFIALLNRVSQAGAAFYSGLLVADRIDQSWIFIAILLAVHILLFCGVALFFWWHIMRLRRPRFLPARYWMIGAGAVVVLVSAAFPLGLLPEAAFGQLPNFVALDPLYLLLVPLNLEASSNWVWGVLGILSIAAGILPWLPFKKRALPVQIHPQACTGCSLCAQDCPYKAISMLERDPGEAHKLIAQVDPKLCVACGVCLGSCEFDAVSLNDLSEDAVWQIVQERLKRHPAQPATICFTCERHAAHGARPYLNSPISARPSVEVIPLPCVAAIPPRLIPRALSGGAGEVRIVGCPPNDCATREGNQWTEARMTRARLPRLKKEYENAPVFTYWLPPDAFEKALPDRLAPAENEAGKTTASQAIAPYSPALTWRNFALTFGVLAILMTVQVKLTQAWTPQDYPPAQARVQFVLPDPTVMDVLAERFTQEFAEPPAHLILLDGETILFDKPYPFPRNESTNPFVAEVSVSSGDHPLTLRLTGEAANTNVRMLYNRVASLAPGQVWIIQYAPRPNLK
jgi:ferredoxin/coenzyme F420-reducing hydrogenase delta subunit/quinol-cytochrome oxidoreductase complex cytochrome b subunit